MKTISGGVTAPKGFRAAGVYCGVKASHAFFTQDFGIPGHEIDSGDDCVRIDMVADLADSTFVQHVTS